jgi:beta-glucosidase/6-phospho-beta-glucosidase/beta-galactosidase
LADLGREGGQRGQGTKTHTFAGWVPQQSHSGADCCSPQSVSVPPGKKSLRQTMRFAAHLLLTAVLLSYCVQGDTIVDFGTQDFMFGIALAPAQSEDQLNDSWLAWANEGQVKAFFNTPHPEDRLWFWSDPQLTLDPIQETSGLQIIRLGVDWGRLAPKQPSSSQTAIQDTAALAQYKTLLQSIKQKGHKVMLTIFHHSLPTWAINIKGWTNSSLINYFADFGESLYDEFSDVVDYWVTLNEPTVFDLLTYCAKMWPPGPPNPSIFTQLNCMLPYVGDFPTSVSNMGKAHNELVSRVRAKTSGASVKFGIAHNVGAHEAAHISDELAAKLYPNIVDYPLMDAIIDSVDFLGINYYGKEIISGSTVAISPDVEYSESGRAISPLGMVEVLNSFHQRYNVEKTARKKNPNVPIPFIITENGISDATDILRSAYLVEHLVALNFARTSLDIPIQGYIWWTMLDNWEWADGYCPKFGFAGVDRNTKEVQIRQSYSLWQTIVQTGQITQAQRDAAWNRIQDAINAGETRTFCRAADGKSSLDTPIQRAFSTTDWRFNPADFSSVAEQ